MKKKTAFTMALLLWLNALNALNGFAQEKPGFNVDNLELSREILSRNYKGSEQTLSVFTLRIKGKQSFPASGWTIYFNTRPMSVGGADSLLFNIEQVNGDLFKLRPKKGFTAIKAGGSKTITVLSTEIKNKTDLSLGFYLVWDSAASKAYAIKHKNINPVKLFEETETKLSADIYRQNQLIKNLPNSQLTRIFPTPVSYKENQGIFKLAPSVSIVADQEFSKEAGLFADELSHMLGKRPVFKGNAEKNVVRIQKGELNGAEAYELSVTPERILITAAGPAGAFYGLQSLKTLFPVLSWKGVQKEIAVPAVTVEDAPRFGFRGIMMDVGRNFQPKKQVLKTLDVMALCKMNVLHFHLNEDEGWRLEIPGLPELTAIGGHRGHTLDEKDHLMPSFGSGPYPDVNSGSGFYTRAEFIEILKYAHARHIRVIPEIETPGHARAAVRSMDARYNRLMKEGKKEAAEQYLLSDKQDKSEYRSVQGWNDNIMNVALPSTYAFLEKVVDEMRAMYTEAGAPLQTIHFGGDEVPAGVWEKSPAVNELLKKDPSIDGVDELWYYYFKRVNAMLKKKQLYLSGWEEIGLRKAMVNRQKKMVLDTRFAGENFHADVWNNLKGNEDLAYKLANAGYKVVLTCVTNLYLDLAVNPAFDEPGQYWGGYIGIEKPYQFIPFNLFKNPKDGANGEAMTQQASAGKTMLTEVGKSNIVGIQGPLWSEIITSAERFEYMMLPKLFAVAERGWATDPAWATEADGLKSNKMYQQAWSEFMNTMAKRELPRIDHYAGGYNYRIPTPGTLVENGMVHANVEYPGMVIRYTTDGSMPTVNSKVYTGPLAAKGTLQFRVFNALGRPGKAATVTTVAIKSLPKN
ncbi:hexosaminidase [Pedobacter africanus]|uniref:Hexosaminidase n=1 Tax=Pedobacter africanus TaxID=151894 RepID=A0ACC6KV72_9SPHI|nr:family 20 glycosylhydrolase [Pedobacter africanus]MDR6783116.1 hexosaminidase [Pedobacter africanus]